MSGRGKGTADWVKLGGRQAAARRRRRLHGKGYLLSAACLLALALAVPAAAVEKDLDGFAEVRFGMSIDEVRAARPDGAYRPEVGEFWISKKVTDPSDGAELQAFRIRVGFSRDGTVERIVNQNLLAERATDYAECRGHFDAMLGRMAAALGKPDSLTTDDAPRFEFGQVYRAGNHAAFRFANGASIDLRSTWFQRPILTRYISEYACKLSADYYRP